MMDRRRFIQIGACSILTLGATNFAQAAGENNSNVALRIIATTDVHGFLTDFDYYKDAPTDKFGYTRTATLIEQARQQVKNSVLVDNGDLIQGNPIADYQAAKGAKEGRPDPSISTFNLMKYDVGTLGNHEFNYGLAYLDQAIAQANYPIINANVVKAEDKTPRFQPYFIQEKTVVDQQGKSKILKIGYIGFVPPQILVWDKANLDGKVDVYDIKQTAEKYVPILKQQGADIVIALAHTGPSDQPYQVGEENAAFHLADVKGIDAIIFGHAHRLFPHKEFATATGVDLEKGTIKGVPESMAGYWGNNISVIDLTLAQHNGKWFVVEGKAALRPIYDVNQKKATVKNHPEVEKFLAPVHQATREFVSQPIGQSSADMYSYLALIQDDPTVKIVNQAQQAYAEQVVKNIPTLAGIPVLSAAAPFKAGGRKNDPAGYTEVDKGKLTFRNAADLYLYPNTLVIVKVTGQELKEWLECSAGMFNQIDPKRTSTQSLLNWYDFRTYNFDTISGVEYQIDVTKPARYDGDCRLINPQGGRIVNLTYQGKAVDPQAEFLIATNNYRAYGNKFPGTGEKNVVYVAPDENRQILANYITQQSQLQGEVNPVGKLNWRIAPINTNTKLDIQVETSPSAKAKHFIMTNAIYPMVYVGQDDVGFALYKVDLTQ
ncbi:2',3'-cyclic-nucleotide 2'-phosphodiesterase [Mergibacter septicus]|uniref:2',3'-cyclic-nucleotide 2'-phosphodiesterase/3'-nucleotidase n=2 Tax=Mergibacter septicus TaxID=221402 RepID=A0A8D4LMV9_9PAST|nr:2',3'-cyclic-nucleotide 2'-phosphodiesterase [Mergibacter septicus]QDJ15578.1 2',3'-cyclic-nucleotide 2'-phosphodiesterase [Mergibacter septicus]